MGDKSGIEWTDATWNPVVGCSLVSPGCTNCYAMKQAHRCAAMGIKKYEGLTRLSPSRKQRRDGGRYDDARPGIPVWTGVVRLDEASLEQPLRWKRGRRIFVNSMSDLFHDALDSWQIAQVVAVMAVAQQHTFQVLTKRPERMRDRLSSGQFWDEVNAFAEELAMENADPLNRRKGDYRAIARDGAPDEPLPNVWWGASVEDQARADERIPLLLDTPAAVRFLSCEPLLGALDPTRVRRFKAGYADREFIDALTGHYWSDLGDGKRDGSWRYGDGAPPWRRLDWVIVGGESGPGARPMHPLWASEIRDQCAAADVPFFFKQWGEWQPVIYGDAESGNRLINLTGGDREIILERSGARGLKDHAVNLRRVGKRVAGRLLGGVEHNAFPPRTPFVGAGA